MISTKKHDDTTGNRLLAALPRKVFRQLLPDLEQITLTLSEVLYNRGDVIRYVYFPSDSGESKQLTNFTNSRIYSFDFSPDGKEIVCARGELSGYVVLLTNK